jgi:hypothetical protein
MSNFLVLFPRLGVTSDSSRHWLAILGCRVALLHIGTAGLFSSAARPSHAALEPTPEKDLRFPDPASKLQASAASTV